MIDYNQSVAAKAIDPENNSYLLRLYHNDECHYCHRIRLALRAKNVTLDTFAIGDIRDLPQDVQELGAISKTDKLPILLERDFVIPRPEIIILYIDERFPTPPLIPTIPSDRVKLRSTIHSLDSGIISLVDNILDEETKSKAALIRKLSNSLIDFSYEYFDDVSPKDHKFNIIDCMLAPILWRIHKLGINLENNKLPKYEPLLAYMNYLFSHPAFIGSCSKKELKMRA